MREYSLFVFTGTLLALLLAWLPIGYFLLVWLLDYFGWSHISLEAKWMLFVGLSVTAAAMVAFLLFGILRLLRPRTQGSRPGVGH